MTLNEGVFSVWNGHSPLQRRPDLLQRRVLADQGDDVGGRPDLGHVLVGYPHTPTVPRRCRRPTGLGSPMAVTIYGVCALTFMMGMYGLEARGRAFVLAFALGCALSSSYGFLSGAWPFGVVEAIWTLVALRRYLGRRPGRGLRPQLALAGRSSGSWRRRRQHGLGGGQAGHRDPEGRAAHVVEPGLVEEVDGRRVAAVLAADADLEAGRVARPRSVPSRTSSPTPSESTTSKGLRGSSPSSR